MSDDDGTARRGKVGTRVPAMDEDEAGLTLAAVDGLGPSAASKLRSRFGSYLAVVRAAFRPGGGALPGGLDGAIRRAALEGCGRAELELARSTGARFVAAGSPEYTEGLAALARPPIGVYVAGRKLCDMQPAVAVVGTRAATRRGLAVARDLAFDLASAGFSVVSGLARGIDTAAHDGALEADGMTVAVLGTGLMHVYPRENEGLARRIRSGGALVSEYPMRQRPRRASFPARNRLIAGLSAGVVVVEAGARSGALITAARALEEGREVFAVPGPITEPLSAGPNGLIKAGAKLVEGVEDILQELEWSTSPASVRRTSRGASQMALLSEPALGPEAVGDERSRDVSRLLEHLTGDPRTVDELSEASGLPTSTVASLLFELELLGRASACPGGTYAAGSTAGRSRRG